ncbi:MAG: hypothetical protein GDA45_06310 [Chromatiales bacterium]|nr:hypothetical protein [Chromatiales bacterium]
MLSIAYRLLLWAGLPLLLLYTITVGVRSRSFRYILQRFGLRLPAMSKQPLWIHCVSVGELNTALVLLEQWLDRYPEDRILVTTSTTSAATVFASKADARMQHCYLPLDYRWSIMRFLKTLKPRVAIVMETEVWFNLFHGCAELNIPSVIINARLSKRTAEANVWLRRYYQQSLALTKAIYAKSERDRDTYMRVGVVPWKIKTLGNLKYAVQFADRQLPNLINKPYILAASTHDDEELQIAKAWQQIEHGNFALVIAPRHPQRLQKILHTLNRHRIRAHCYHPNATIGDGDTVVYDRIGQLPQLIKHAHLVFLGGSLIDKGGHNILEAAMLGTPQVTGFYLDNIAEEAQALNQAGGLIIVDSANALPDIFTRVVQQPNYYQQNAVAAKNYLAQRADVAQNYIAELVSLNFQP